MRVYMAWSRGQRSCVGMLSLMCCIIVFLIIVGTGPVFGQEDAPPRLTAHEMELFDSLWVSHGPDKLGEIDLTSMSEDTLYAWSLYRHGTNAVRLQMRGGIGYFTPVEWDWIRNRVDAACDNNRFVPPIAANLEEELQQAVR